MHVLVIEDSDADFRLIERALGDEFTLRRAATLAAALSKARCDSFDLVILDLTLEDSSGYDTFERAHAALPQIPIVVLSGMDNDELALRAVSSGAQDYVRKSRLIDYPLDRTARYAIERRRSQDVARKAQQQYRTLLDNLPIAAYTCDPTGLINYYNEKAVELWGREPNPEDPSDRFCGSLDSFATDGTPIPRDQSWTARALRERTAFKGHEFVVQLASGERRAVLGYINPILNDDGELQGAINVLVDVTNQRLAEEKLRESERFARATVNSLSAHIAILDEAGSILAVNTAWRRFAAEHGVSVAGHGVGANYLTACETAGGDSAVTARAIAAGIRGVLRGEQHAFHLEYPCHTYTEPRWFAVSVTPFDGEGPTRVVVSHEDITAHRLADRLVREQSGLREAVVGMEQVLGVVGHELRTPLAALRAISEFLTTDGARDTAEGERFLREISAEVDRMSDMVNNLLEAARLNSGRALWNWSEIDVAETVEEAIASIRPLVDLRQVRIDCRIDDAARHSLGDADAIRRLLVNLLSNAQKHTIRGQIEVTARTDADRRGDWIELAVRDTGCGIPPRMLARLGEAFALNSGVVGNNHVRGTGLGLAICKEIAKAHGGDIRVESIQGKGTTVTARLRIDLSVAANGDTVRITPCREDAA